MRRPEGEDEIARPEGDQEPGRPAEERQDDALGHQLAHQAQPAGPHRQADGNLLAPRRGACQEEVGDVGAGDQQDQTDDGHQEAAGHDEKTPEVRVDRRLGDREKDGTPPAVGGGILLLQALGDRLDGGVRLLDRHARLETGDGIEQQGAAVVVVLGLEAGQDLRVHGERYPQLGPAEQSLRNNSAERNQPEATNPAPLFMPPQQNVENNNENAD